MSGAPVIVRVARKAATSLALTQNVGASPELVHPAARAALLQRRLRGLTRKLRQGEAFHVELDAIASELGVLLMQLEGFEPAGRTWRTTQRRQA